VLLRMHGFGLAEQQEPTAGSTSPVRAAPVSTKVSESASAANATNTSPPEQAPPVAETAGEYRVTGEWPDIIASLSIGGLLQQLADNAVVDSKTDSEIVLTLDKKYAQLHNPEREAELQLALRDFFGNSDLKLSVNVGTPGFETPAAMRKRLTDERQRAAERAINADPNVKALRESFEAEINSGSIRPRT